MDVALENLSLLPTILERLEMIEKRLVDDESKRWMSVKEAAHYIGYAEETIYKIKEREWHEGLHYFKKGKKLIFDSHALDKWVMGDDGYSNLGSERQRLHAIVDSVLKGVIDK